MNLSKEKWSLGALALAVIVGLFGIATILGGVGYYAVVGEKEVTATYTPPMTPQAQVVASTSVQPITTAANTAASPATTTPAATTVAAPPPADSMAASTTTQPVATPAPPVASAPATLQLKPTSALLTPEQEKEADTVIANLEATDVKSLDYERARWHPIHFQPAISKASDTQCLKCHQEVLDTNTRDASPAGLKKENTLAWYQTLDTYQGDQLTFHQRHLTAPFIKKVANMSCNTCHQGNNSRDETGNTAADSPTGLTMRKMADPNVCLMCHGQFPYKNMGLPGPWHESGALFQNNCLACHAGIRTTRHNVNFLNASAIEQEGAANSDTCFGCHGGRSWYRVAFPYPRHAWPGSTAAPDWAKDRPTESDLRYLIQSPNAAAK